MTKSTAEKISGLSREICKICYHVNPVGFTVPDTLWQVVVPPHLQRHVVCVTCFTRLADEALIAWDDDIAFYPVSMATHLGLLAVELPKWQEVER